MNLKCNLNCYIVVFARFFCFFGMLSLQLGKVLDESCKTPLGVFEQNAEKNKISIIHNARGQNTIASINNKKP